MRAAGALLGVVLAALVVTSVLGLGPLILNREGEQRIAFLLGDPVAVITEPGPAVTWPFVRISTSRPSPARSRRPTRSAS
jgi:regulator of protease activity HflC (stomatin/prohibitin superfamily)